MQEFSLAENYIPSRSYKIMKELKRLWPKKLNFPHIPDVKLCTLLKIYDQCRKKRNYEVLNELFDMKLLNSIWLSSEDKQFYFPFVKDYEKLRP